MAIVNDNAKKGFLFTGKMGNTVFYKLNGRIVGRTIGKKSNGSPKQLTVQVSLKLITSFISTMIPYVDVGLRAEAKKRSRNTHNVAVSLNYGSVGGEYPDVFIDFGKVILSKGSLAQPLGPSVKMNGQVIEFSWQKELGVGSVRGSDVVMLLAYFPETNRAVFSLAAGCRRDLKAGLLLSPTKDVSFAETYISFRTGSQMGISDSVYCGRIML